MNKSEAPQTIIPIYLERLAFLGLILAGILAQLNGIYAVFEFIYSPLQYSPLAFFYIIMTIWGVILLYLSIWRETGRYASLGMMLYLLALSLFKESVLPPVSYGENYQVKFLFLLLLFTIFAIACLYCTVRAIIAEAEKRYERRILLTHDLSAGQTPQGTLWQVVQSASTRRKKGETEPVRSLPPRKPGK